MDGRRPANAGAQNPAYRPTRPPPVPLTCFPLAMRFICGPLSIKSLRAFLRIGALKFRKATLPLLAGLRGSGFTLGGPPGGLTSGGILQPGAEAVRIDLANLFGKAKPGRLRYLGRVVARES